MKWNGKLSGFLLLTLLATGLSSCGFLLDGGSGEYGYNYNPSTRYICTGIDCPEYVGPLTPDTGFRVMAQYDSLNRVISTVTHCGQKPYSHAVYSYSPDTILKIVHFSPSATSGESDYTETYNVENALVTSMTRRYHTSTECAKYEYDYSDGNLVQVTEIYREDADHQAATTVYDLVWTNGNLTQCPYFPVNVTYTDDAWPEGFVAVPELYWLYPSQDGFLLAAGLMGNTPRNLPLSVDTSRMASPQSNYNYSFGNGSDYPVTITYESDGAGGTGRKVPVSLTWWPRW